MLSNLFKVNFMEDFLVHEASAPSKKGPGAGQRGTTYTDSMLLPVYQEEEGKNMTLKDFTTKHLREYEPGVFLGLIADQPAVANWMSSDH